MRHRKKGRKFGRSRSQRKALLYGLVSSIIFREKLTTTTAKAREARSFLEKSITRAKEGSLRARRLLAKSFPPTVVKKLVDELGPRYKDRPGGYVRITKIGSRKSDGAEMAVIELIK